MTKKIKIDISKYFVVGPENTLSRPLAPMIEDVIKAGFTFIQIRSKTASAKELIKLTKEAALVIAKLGKSNEVALVVNDRLDVILAAREEGIKVDGIHIGQSDIPASVCRKYLGEDSIVGVSARTDELFDYIKNTDVSIIDYFGAGPLHESITKPDCGLSMNGNVITRTYEEIEKLALISTIPVVVGGGVKIEDIPKLAKTGISGFFVVSAISQAQNPKEEATKLVQAWDDALKNKK